MMIMKITRLFAILILFPAFSGAQEIFPLYPGAVPNAKTLGYAENSSLPANGAYNRVKTPTLEVYLPDKEKASGTAVIICPGGGYSVVVYRGEGIATATELAKAGVAAFVLKYRLPNDSTMVDKSIGPLQDVQQAIKVVREGASQWGVDTGKVGIMGFSAGGHLAASGATHFNQPLIENTSGTNLRPSFQILVYPVISFQDSLAHAGSRRQLLGSNPLKEKVDFFSNELQVSKASPPAYLTHAADDATVDVDNSIVYFEALRKLKVPVEMHIYPFGGHGSGLRTPGWMEPLFRWMKRNGWLKD